MLWLSPRILVRPEKHATGASWAPAVGQNEVGVAISSSIQLQHLRAVLPHPFLPLRLQSLPTKCRRGRVDCWKDAAANAHVWMGANHSNPSAHIIVVCVDDVSLNMTIIARQSVSRVSGRLADPLFFFSKDGSTIAWAYVTSAILSCSCSICMYHSLQKGLRWPT